MLGNKRTRRLDLILKIVLSQPVYRLQLCMFISQTWRMTLRAFVGERSWRKAPFLWWLEYRVLENICFLFSSVQFSSVPQSCLTLCNPMNHSTPGFPVHHQLPEFTQTHVHWVGDAIQPSHSLSSPSPPAPNPSQHQGLFHWVSSSHEVAKVLEFQL